MKQKYKSLVKDTVIFALGSMGSKLILFFLVPLYTNYLTAEEYGTAELVFTFAQLILPFSSLVMYEAVMRFGMMKEEKKENVALLGVVMMGVCGAVTLLITPLIGLYEPVSDWKWYLCIYIIFSCVNQTEMHYLKVKNKNRSFAAISVMETAVLAAANLLFLAVCHKGVAGYLEANILAQTAAAAGAFLVSGLGGDLARAKLDFQLWKRMAAYSAPLILSNVSWWAIHSSDKLMLESMTGAFSLGLYTVATKIPSLINVMISIFASAWRISSVKEIESTNDKKFYASVFEMYSFLSFLAGVAIMSVIKPFMAVYVGAEFQEAWRYVPLLLAGAVFYSIASYFDSLYAAMKKTVNSMWTTIFCAAVNIFVNYAAIREMGIWGALLGTVTAYFVMAQVRMLDVHRYLHLSIHWKKYVCNEALLMGESILISANWHIYLTSAAAVILFCVNNFQEIRMSVRFFVHMKMKG